MDSLWMICLWSLFPTMPPFPLSHRHWFQQSLSLGLWFELLSLKNSKKIQLLLDLEAKLDSKSMTTPLCKQTTWWVSCLLGTSPNFLVLCFNLVVRDLSRCWLTLTGWLLYKGASWFSGSLRKSKTSCLLTMFTPTTHSNKKSFKGWRKLSESTF